MATQDLVVKLMLNSGAFGNDIREAERKAKQFSDKMKSSGKSVGEFTKEIGLNTGALGKLGGAITGAGGVAMAVGAFKSVMESSYSTAKTFQSTIAGFKGVLDTFQRSLANFDFSNFNGGMDEMFKRAKEAKEAMIDAQRSTIVYNSLFKEDLALLKSYEAEYRNVDTTSERRNEIKEAIKELERTMGENLNYYRIALKNAFKSGVESFDGKLREISFSDMAKLFRDAQFDILTNNDEVIRAEYDKIKNTIVALEEDKKKYAEKIGWYEYMLDPQKNTNLATRTGWFGEGREQKEKELREYKAELYRVKKEIDTLIKSSQDIIFKNIIFGFTQEEMSQYITLIDQLSDAEKTFNDTKLQWMGWAEQPQAKSAKSQTKEQIEAAKTLKQELNDKIKALQDEIDLLDVGTEEWRKKIIEQERYISKLAEILEREKEIKALYSQRLTSVNSPKTMTTDEIMKNALDTGLSNWRNNQKGFYDLNIAISSSIDMLNALSSAFSLVGDESSATLQIITNTMGSLASGIMGFIQIQQAAAAAAGTASAAALPFPYNLAAIATAMSTILSVFANIRSMTAGKFADGGIVGGTSYSGDKLFAMVNSGEMILNKRQQSNLSNMLGVGGQVEFHISGETLVGVLNNIDRKKHLIR
jgi:chromosome segregation ATPase